LTLLSLGKKNTKNNPHPNSTFFNLAREEENLFSLKTYGAGYSYTYNPPEMSGPEIEEKLFILLGNRQRNDLSEFVVYLHQRRQFWPRPGSDIGQSKAIR
jgi:hypothetical protein